MTRDEITVFVKQSIAEETGTDARSINPSAPLSSLGIDSLSAIVILNRIEDHYHTELSPLCFWDHPTVGEFTNFLCNHLKAE
ncbi:MAG: acyl carrier protein [Bacteroidetes bacterium]|nr:acyl carrier protein [Bacteroidota bacterium]